MYSRKTRLTASPLSGAKPLLCKGYVQLIVIPTLLTLPCCYRDLKLANGSRLPLHLPGKFSLSRVVPICQEEEIWPSRFACCSSVVMGHGLPMSSATDGLSLPSSSFSQLLFAHWTRC